MTDKDLYSLTSKLYKDSKLFDKTSYELHKSIVDFCKKPTENNLDVISEELDNILEIINNIQLTLGSFI